MRGLKASIRDNIYLRFIMLFGSIIKQGISGTDKSERLFKIIRSILFAIIFMIILYDKLNLYNVFYSLILGHILSYIIFNLNFASIMLQYFRIGQLNKKKYFSFLEKNCNSFSKNELNSIKFIVIFGSMARGELHSRSDIDLSIVRKKGIKNFWVSLLVLEKLRFRAKFAYIPFDSCISDSTNFLKKRNKIEEYPILVYGNMKDLLHTYRKLLSLDDAKKLNGLN